MNVKSHGADVRLNDPLEASTCSPDDCSLNTLIQFGDMALGCVVKKAKELCSYLMILQNRFTILAMALFRYVNTY